MDRVFLEGLVFYGYHGVNAEERQQGQRFVVSVQVGLDLGEAGRSDRIENTVNYAEVYRLVRDIVEGPPLHLLEAVAHEIASALLNRIAAEEVEVRIEKPWAPVKGMVAGTAGVAITRRRPC